MFWVAASLALVLVGAVVLVHYGTRWGSTAAERALDFPSDRFLDGGPPARVVMTRAIWIRATPERVWPWIAQVGRGAGWYSFDRLDNGGKTSARHVVSWIPAPALGDATAIGYLRRVDPGRSLAWWLDGGSFLGVRARLVFAVHVFAGSEGSRVVSRISADASGAMGWFVMLVFRVLDSIMACRQLVGLRARVEHRERHGDEPLDPETGERDQYQHYEIVYADGSRAGVAGKEAATRWREVAIRDGVLGSPHVDEPNE